MNAEQLHETYKPILELIKPEIHYTPSDTFGPCQWCDDNEVAYIYDGLAADHLFMCAARKLSTFGGGVLHSSDHAISYILPDVTLRATSEEEKHAGIVAAVQHVATELKIDFGPIAKPTDEKPLDIDIYTAPTLDEPDE